MDGRGRITSIDHLQLEVLKRVLDFLSIDDKRMARLVSQRWRFTLDDFGWPESVWFRPRCVEGREKEVMEGFLKSHRTMDEVFLQNCDIRMSKLPHGERRIPDIRGTVDIGVKNSQATIVNFLKSGCTYANALIVEDNSLWNTRRYVISGLLRQKSIEFAYLTSFEVVVNVEHKKLLVFIYKCNSIVEIETGNKPEDNNHLKTCSSLLKHIRIPNIREFKFKLIGPLDVETTLRSWLHCRRAMENYISFLVNHASTLKILYNKTFSIYRQNHRFDFTCIPDDLKLESCETITHNLRHLEPMLLPTLRTRAGLKTIKIACDEGGHQPGNDPTDAANIRQILTANSTTLEEATVCCCHLDLNWIRHCTKLKTLCLEVDLMNGDEATLNMMDPYCFPRLTHVELVLFSADPNPLSNFGYQSLLNSCRTTIRYLKIRAFVLNIDNNNESLQTNVREWVNGLINLEALSVEYLGCDSTAIVGPMRYLELRQFDAGGGPDMSAEHYAAFANWIGVSIPKLKSISMCGYANLQSLQILLAMKGCKEVQFLALKVDLDEIENFCNDNSWKNIYQMERFKVFGWDAFRICRLQQSTAIN